MMVSENKSNINHLCDMCVGRILHNSYPQKNLDLGYDVDICLLCDDTLKNFEKFSISLVNSLERYEFDNFNIGIKLNSKVTQKEEHMIAMGVRFIPIKTYLVDLITKTINDQLTSTIEKHDPIITIIVDIKNNLHYKLQIKSIYILGKYRKLIRGIPQTKWPCTFCKGKKCKSCNMTGLQYPKSVESIVADPFQTVSYSNDVSFHGAGREDIDALMLGSGRPFVLELKSPRIRTFQLSDGKLKINRSQIVEVENLRFCDKSIIKKIKQSSPNSDKSYTAIIDFESAVNDEILKKLLNFKFPINLKQRTPKRVSHRRADLIRDKRIFDIQILKQNSPNNVKLNIHAQGGAYIKEFISGDDGRTVPSVSSITGINCICTELDVISVDDKGLF